jgi:alkanesulfonate monooxygenase SsuD/methylene tetrahydromethanopterin reductase-like flavin-dependent oxidoreductase (luciferase family)
MPPVRVGIQLPEVEREVRWPEYLAMAKAAEAVGFDSIWVGDHLLYRGDDGLETGPWDAWTLLAALAAGTGRVQLGPLVACTAFHPPGLIARMAATLAEVSGGRFVLGLGAGWNEEEFRAFGLPYDHRVYVHFGNSPEGFAALNERISEAARLAGRDPAEIERSACVYVALDDADAERANTHEVPPLEGSPERLAADLSDFAEAGADEAILVVNPISERSIRELAPVLALVRSA